MKVAQLNVRSLILHLDEFKQLVYANNFDIICLTETWLNSNITSDIVQIPGYLMFREDRQGNNRGGGVAVYVSNRLKVKISEIHVNKEYLFEYTFLKLTYNNQSTAVGVIYRPPDKNITLCVEQLDDCLSHIMPLTDNVILLGDLNINLFNLNNPLSKCFDAYGLTQIIDEATRITHNTQTLIDPICLTCPDLVTVHGTINADLISDHRLVYCSLNIPVNKRKQKFIQIRNFKNFNIDDFSTDLHNVAWDNIIYNPNIDDKVEFLTSNILQLFNKHAPIRTIRVSKPKAPWLTDVIKIMIREREKAHNKYNITKNEADWSRYKELRNFTLSAIRREKKSYLRSLYSMGGDKKGWQGLKELGIQSNNKKELPSDLASPEEINLFFSEFINSSSDHCDETIEYYNLRRHTTNKQFFFKLVTPEEIDLILHNIKSNAFGSDCLSPIMLKYCLPCISPYVTHIINTCLERGVFPSAWKQALVQPIPKVNNPASLSDLRPISILPVLSKILEKIIYKQLYAYVDENNILPECQSGFRKSHSTTSALLNVTDNIIRACDEKKITALVLLDFSKAFDTVNHELLCAKLKYIGLDEVSLNLFCSYFMQRSQKVTVQGITSTSVNITSGVPQGSILGPLLFLIYTSDLFTKLRVCKIQGYADDTQIYHSFFPSSAHLANDTINSDLSIINEFCFSHNLKINANKSFLMLFGNKRNLEDIKNDFNLVINNEVIPYTNKCKNLGLTIDSNLRFVEYVNILVKRAYCVLRLLYSNQSVLGYNLRKKLCESLVLSIFNYGDIVYGPCIDSITRNRIQKIQNSCCRFVFGLRKFDRVSDNLKVLGWLPMQKIWELHLLNFVHRLLHTGVPSYLRTKLTFRFNVHNVQVRSRNTLSIPKYETAFFLRSFTYVSAKAYNDVPNDLKHFSCATFKYKLRQKFMSDLRQ